VARRTLPATFETMDTMDKNKIKNPDRALLSDDELLDAFFNEHKETIADNGFCERVLQGLPERENVESVESQQLRRWRIGLNLFGVAAVVGLLVYFGFFSQLWDFQQGVAAHFISQAMNFDFNSLLVKLMLMLHRLPELLPSPTQIVTIAVAILVLTTATVKQLVDTYKL